MKNNIIDFLSNLQPFDSLPESDIAQLSGKISTERYETGAELFYRGKSEIQNVYVIKKGRLELFFQQNGSKKSVDSLKEGDVFGGISILINADMAVRNVRVTKAVTLYVISKETFLNLCTGSHSFYQFFIDSYGRRMLNRDYSAGVTADQAYSFLKSTSPFSFLPEEELKRTAALVSVITYPRNSTIFIQGESRLEHLYILKSGSAQRLSDENGERVPYDFLESGDAYGGASLLSNGGMALHTLRTSDNSTFYKLPEEHFARIALSFKIVAEFFTDALGKRILDKSYSSLMSEKIQQHEESFQFFNQTVESICNKEIVFCKSDSSIQNAAAVMSRYKCGSLLVKNEKGEYIGIITDSDFKNKVIAKGCDIKRPVAEITSSPLITISDHALIMEALLQSMEKNIRHHVVTDLDKNIIGVVTNRDLLSAQSQSPFLFIREIEKAQSVEKLAEKQSRLPKAIHGLVSKGAKARNITRFVTSISDAILKKLVEFAIDKLGEPPVKFAFMIMGSEGRQEQTLKTDQDNAIIFEDVGEKSLKYVTDYFLRFGDTVCTWLDRVGYTLCKGNIMAKNPRLCQPFSVWRQYFHTWIHDAEPVDLLNASIFFDFRTGYGDEGLVTDLKTLMFESLKDWSGFFRRLTENALHFKPPLGIFRNFIVESKGRHKDSFDIKAAMMPIVDFARIYALHNSISDTNTHDRLRKIFMKKVLSWKDYNDIDQSYSYMMQLRFVRQVKMIVEEKRKPDNYINPKKLSRLEQKMLKEIFRKIETFQEDSSLRFTGV